MVLGILLFLVVVYLWLRGWWFVGLLAGLYYCFGDVPHGTPDGHRSYLVSFLIAFGPMTFWHGLREDRRLKAEKRRAVPFVYSADTPREVYSNAPRL